MNLLQRYINFHKTYTRILPSGSSIEMEIDSGTKLLLIEAEEMGIYYTFVPNSDFIRLSIGDHHEYVRHQVSDINKAVDYNICANKVLTKMVLQEFQLPVARGYPLYKTDSQSYREKMYHQLHKPLVIKPSIGSYGIHVKLNIESLEEYNNHINFLFNLPQVSPPTKDIVVLVEETIIGNEYRIIATRDKVLAVMNRQPASVLGDGKHTIKELIEIKNKDPMRNISPDLYPHILIDEDMIAVLARQKANLTDVPIKNKKIQLRYISNIMAGGDPIDVTDKVHESVKELAITVTRLIPGNLLTGMDFITTDITKDQSTQKCAIVEVNRTPEFDMHDLPMHGKNRNVAREIIHLLFPELKNH